MHTTIIIAFGLILLALMLFIGQQLGFTPEVMTYSFIVLWLALTTINGAIGVKIAERSLRDELMTGCMVFAVPVATLVLYMALTADT